MASFILVAWINGVALKEANYPVLWYWSDYRMKVAVARNGYICILGEET
jgi:hypothetical protein